MTKTISLTSENHIGSLQFDARGVAVRVYASNDVAVLKTGLQETPFTSAADLRELVANLIAAAERIENS